MALFTTGIDIGTGAVKTVLMRTEDGESEWLGRQIDRIRRRDPQVLARQALEGLLAEHGLAEDDLA